MSRRIRQIQRLAVMVTIGLQAVAMAARPSLAQQQGSAGESSDGAAIVVLDGSNSMNGRLAGDRLAKHVVVREALRSALPGVSSEAWLGLAAFGARRPSDCTDAEVLVAPARKSGEAIQSALERFQPRGFSPVVLAMRTAVRALPSGARRASVVLVLDDLASCRGEDPCAVAADLKRQLPQLSIHAVGLGLKRPDAQVLGCVAQQTGGELIEVAEGAEVGPAIERALRLALPAPPREPVAIKPPAPVPVARPAAASGALTPGVVIDETKPGVHFTARLSEGGPPLAIPILWRIERASDGASTPQGPRASVVEATAPGMTHLLQAGRYIVHAEAGLVKASRTFEVDGTGPLPVPVVLEAALLKISVTSARGGPALDDAHITVSGGGQSADQRLAPLKIVRGGRLDLAVPPGAYRIAAKAGVARIERAVAIGAGIVTDMELDLGAGRLVIEEAQGRQVIGAGETRIVVEADEVDGAARREVVRVSGNRLDTMLPAGAYAVTLRRGEAEVRERVVVRAGDTASRQLTLGLARVRLSSRLGGSTPTGLEVRYRIERLDSTAPIVERWSEAEPVIDLTPGSYKIEARIGRQNAVVTRVVEIRQGFEHRMKLDPQAAGVRLKLGEGMRGAGGLGSGEVHWHIMDERGASLWRTMEPEPHLALAGGRYLVRAETRERKVERAIEVRAGETRQYEVGE